MCNRRKKTLMKNCTIFKNGIELNLRIIIIFSIVQNTEINLKLQYLIIKKTIVNKISKIQELPLLTQNYLKIQELLFLTNGNINF